MILILDDILTPAELTSLNNTLAEANFVDGKTTAGWHAKLVKHNTQLDKQSEHLPSLQEIVKTALNRHGVLQMAVRPKIIHSLLFSRYETGMSYGMHVDNALMGKQQSLRSDVSFTLFLSPPESYGAGELIIESAGEERSYKLQAGSIILYPSSTLHRVATVTEGVRLVAVGWIQSLIRDPSQREILFELDTARRSLFAKEGKTVEFDLISKTLANLLRMWVE
jgi:PKHD-type hydroxylase